MTPEQYENCINAIKKYAPFRDGMGPICALVLECPDDIGMWSQYGLTLRNRKELITEMLRCPLPQNRTTAVMRALHAIFTRSQESKRKIDQAVSARPETRYAAGVSYDRRRAGRPSEAALVDDPSTAVMLERRTTAPPLPTVQQPPVPCLEGCCPKLPAGLTMSCDGCNPLDCLVPMR
jgi:hypothetical protein